MNAIYKYPVPFDTNQAIELPRGAMLLDLQIQNDSPMLWAVIDLDEPARQKFHIRMSGSGLALDFDPRGAILQRTTQMGNLVWHWFVFFEP